MTRYALVLLFVIIVPWRSLGQNPDSITIIPMATTQPDSVKQVNETIGTKRMRNPDSFWRRIAFGGNLGFQFGTITGFNISPEVRIRAVDQLYVGVGFIYQYFKVSEYFYDTVNREFLNYSSNTFGGRLYLRYYLRSLFDSWAGNFFAHAEYEYLNFVVPYKEDPNGSIIDPSYNHYIRGNSHREVHSVFVGGGYSQPISNRVWLDLLIMFNLNDSPYSPYTNPVFRLGVGVGL